jgi:dsDNA-specific endonuclease/ATPase MutS2
MDHTLDFRQRLQLDDLTIPITDLLLTKLQVVRLAEKDVKDIIAVLEDHQIGRRDGREILNLDYVAERCSSDWGLYRTVSDNLDKMNQFIQIIVPSSGEREELSAKLDAIRTSLKEAKKGIRWRIRNIISRRMKWYEKVEVGEGEAF